MNRFEDMQVFIRIVESGSITKAADQMNMVKSAVSQRLARLENHLGTVLIQRTTRSQNLTSAGQKYFQQCLRIIEEIDEIEADIQQEKQALAGKIRLAAPYSFGLKQLSQALMDFYHQHPDVQFDIDFNDRFVDLVNEGFDLGIRIGQLSDSTLRARIIGQSQLVLCASPAYIKQHGEPKHPNDLNQNHKKLRYTTSSETWDFKGPKGKIYKVKVPSILVCNNGEFMTEAAIEGSGMAVIPDFICYQAIREGSLVPLLCDFRLNTGVNIYAVYPQNRYLAVRVRKLIDFLSAYFEQHADWQIYK